MIAHIDVDAFFASALQRRRPDLRNKPLLALGMGGGCVIAASYEAKADGVKTGMRLIEAKKLCPHAIAVPSDFEEALLASREIESILSDHCPHLEKYSIDEWFLDLEAMVGGVPVHLQTQMIDLQQLILRKTALTVSIGTGPSKLLAKMASEYRKPAGVTVIDHAHLSREVFLQDRPAAAIPGIGGRRNLHAEAHGWVTAWDIAQAPVLDIQKLFGKPGLEMQQELQGEAIWSVEAQKAPPKSISRCRSFSKTSNHDLIFSHLLHHATYTILKMRRHNLTCRVVAVWLRDGEYKSQSRDAKLPRAMDTQEEIVPYLRHCFERLYDPKVLCTQIGLALYGLHPKAPLQYSLFEEAKKTDGNEQIQQALDDIHNRFGREAVKRAAALPLVGKKRHVATVN